jgi:hypothetical protein
MAKKVIKKAQSGKSISTNPMMQAKLDKAKAAARSMPSIKENPMMKVEMEKSKYDLDKKKLEMRTKYGVMKRGGKVKKK